MPTLDALSHTHVIICGQGCFVDGGDEEAVVDAGSCWKRGLILGVRTS